MNHVILIELDAILDTRYTVLSETSQDLMNEEFMFRYFKNRVSDLFFETERQEIYEKAYASRNVETVKKSLRSLLHIYLKGLLKRSSFARFDGVITGDIIVRLNTYPYIFEEPVREAIRRAFNYLLGEEYRVELCHFSLEALTPTILRQTYGSVFYYDFHPWLDIHAEELKRVNCTKVKIYTSALIKDKDALIETIKKRGSVDVFQELEEFLKFFIDITHIPAETFSVDPTIFNRLS